MLHDQSAWAAGSLGFNRYQKPNNQCPRGSGADIRQGVMPVLRVLSWACRGRVDWFVSWFGVLITIGLP